MTKDILVCLVRVTCPLSGIEGIVCSGSVRGIKQSSVADRHIYGTCSDVSGGVCHSSPVHILLFIVVRGRWRLCPSHRPSASVCSNRLSHVHVKLHLFARSGLLCMPNIPHSFACHHNGRPVNLHTGPTEHVAGYKTTSLVVEQIKSKNRTAEAIDLP